ncbi:MAG: aspartate 1-decarboxylase [Alphaproteobacteria bacterium]
MYLSLLKCKLHGATVTDANLNYEGSIGIARDLMDKAGLMPHEKVDVLNFRNGARLTTYVIEYPAKSGQIVMNGPAAHLVTKGDRIIVCAYAAMPPKKARKHTPTIVILGGKNTVQPARDKTMIDPKRGLKKTVRKKPAKRKAKK